MSEIIIQYWSNDGCWTKSELTEKQVKQMIKIGKLVRINGYLNPHNGLMYQIIEVK